MCDGYGVYCIALSTEPEHVQNFTAIIVSESHVQLFWIADGRAEQYTVFWHHHSKVCIEWLQ